MKYVHEKGTGVLPKTRLIAPIILGLFVLSIWFYVSHFKVIGEYALPAPDAVFTQLIIGIKEGYLLKALNQTFLEALLGCFFAAIFGIPLGLAISHWKIFSAAIEPYLAASQAIPAVAIAPLLVTWIGYGTAPIVALCGVIVVFPIVINTALGIREIDSDLISAARLDGAGGIRLLKHIEIPLAGSSILAGLRTGFTLAVTGAVVGEMVIGGQTGLGITLITAQHLNNLPAMFATIILLAIATITLYQLLRFFEMRLVDVISP